MNSVQKLAPFVPSPSEYILDNFEPTDRIAVLVLNRNVTETIQRITSAQKASNLGFQAWLRYKNGNGSDIYIGMNPLKKDASTRTKEEIDSIKACLSRLGLWRFRSPCGHREFQRGPHAELHPE